MEKNVLALDLGASSGRAMMGHYDGNSIQIEEIHRFLNSPVHMQKTMYWDVLHLQHEITQSLVLANSIKPFDSVAVDTWGVDFGLISSDGYLMENPVHYRDSRTKGMVQHSFSMIDDEEFYSITGNQFMEINTAFQLLSLQKYRKNFLQQADKLLLMPDLFHYFLSGEMVAEETIASTTQLFDAKKRDWSSHVLDKLNIPRSLFPDIVPSGTVIGNLQQTLCSTLDIPTSQVIAVAGHDTQCALLATPAVEKDFIFLSCGTWSLLGTELDAPLISEKSLRYNLTNEAGYGGKTAFLKNITGLWLLQESRRQWAREGEKYTFSQLEELAQKAAPLVSFIDPDDESFTPSGNMPERIRAYCKRTNQPTPSTVGEITRCVLQSLALKYRHTIAQIMDCTGKEYETIYMVGGGTQNSLLCQLTANACNRKVVAGPKEATILGNVAIQLLAGKELSGMEQARSVIANSQTIVEYEPLNGGRFLEAVQQFTSMIAKTSQSKE